MSKCIMVDDIKNALIELARSDKWLGRETTTNIIEALANLPTIDIVHCKDCKFWQRPIPVGDSNSDKRWCEHFVAVQSSFDFCSDGERIEK